MIVFDASVFAKLFLVEEDSAKAETLIEHILANQIEIIAPSALLYEALSIALRHDVPFKAVLGLLSKLCGSGLVLDEPTIEELLKAEEITTTGHAKSGYPALNDSIYHAMAIERGGIFVTADRRHFAKSKQFGSVVLLADWHAG